MHDEILTGKTSRLYGKTGGIIVTGDSDGAEQIIGVISNFFNEKKQVFEIKNPADAFLPKLNISSTYVFATEFDFFAYPNNYNHFVTYYRNTFQHGGVSLEEMIIPFIKLSAK